MASENRDIMEDEVKLVMPDNSLKEENHEEEMSGIAITKVEVDLLEEPSKKKAKRKRFEKGIISNKRAKKEHGNWRPKVAVHPRNFDPSRKLNVNGCQITLRQCKSFVMFEIESFVNLLARSLPLRMTFEELQVMVAAFAKSRRPQMTAEAKAWRHEFLSWKSFKHFLERNLHDQCVRDILRTYVPHEDTELKFDGSLGLSDAPVTFLSSEADFIKIAGVTIPFMVKCGKIYFDLYPAFTLMGQLQVALKSEWREIDSLLVEQGFNLRAAFRINTTLEGSYKTWRSLRSAITYEAFKALIKSDIVPLGQRKERLIAILDHLDTDMMGLTNAREDLVSQLQCIVDENVHTAETLLDDFSVEKNVMTGTEICYRGCGRYYHYTVRCCHNVHKLRFGNTGFVNYIVFNGRIFFDKCTAFSILNKMSIVKYCDFRTVDKILTAENLDIPDHFLNEATKESSSYGKRTHISFEAIKTLVENNFTDPKNEVDAKKLVKKIQTHLAGYKSKCVKYEGKDRVQDNLSDFSEDGDSSSSGIESGGASDSGSSSGKNSPDFLDDSNEEDSFFVDKVCNIDVHLSIDNNHLYGDVHDLKTLVGMEYDHLVKVLKRKYRNVDVDVSFRPRIFKVPTKHCFISVKCFVLLLEKQYIKHLGHGYNRPEVVQELDNLIQKHTKVEEEVDDEEIPTEEKAVKKSEMMDLEDSVSGATIKIADIDIAYQVKDSNLYLDRKTILSELFFVSSQHGRNCQKMDEILSNAGADLDKSFIWHGKNRKFISIPALHILRENNYYALKKPELKAEIDASFDKLTKEKQNLVAKKLLHLSSFDAIPYKIFKGKVYLKTLQFLKAVGCQQKYLKDKPSKSYFVVLRLLKKRGMDIKGCFLKQGICKYGYISVNAAFTLFKSESGPFRDKRRMKLLHKELDKALKKFPQYVLANHEEDSSIDVVADTITIGDVQVRYQIKDGIVYFHRMTIFDAVGLEKAVIMNARGLPAVNRILTSHKMDVSKSYLRSPDEQFGFISFSALWTILDAEDPLVTMLERKSEFIKSLLNLLQRCLSHNLTPDQLLFNAIPWHILNGKFMLHKAKLIAHSGLYDNAHLLPLGDHVNLEQLMKFVKLDSDQKRSHEYSNLIWIDMISAVMHETPRLRVHVKLIEFREKLMRFLELELASYLSKPDSVRSDHQPQQLNSVQIKPDLDSEQEFSVDKAEMIEEPMVVEEETSEEMGKDEKEVFEPEMCLETEQGLSIEEFSKINESIRDIRSGLIGDWRVKKCETDEIRLIVNPGYGASKKISFVQPDVSAILKYELCLRPGEPVQLSINDLRVPFHLLESLFERELKRGLFGLLYNLLTLRPCFGNFQPELVETLEKRSRISGNSTDMKNLVIDTNFIGSSQNGRTYAGTVRSKECSVLATSKVSDMCTACSDLQCCVVINRSVLSSPIKNRTMSQESSSSSGSNGSLQHQQQSVWKVEESSLEGCTFLCPQLQSYNTSLPHHFVSSSQASSVVEHRVYIAHDLALKVSLNNKNVAGKSFQEFEKTKQVGPLLDNVASMRICVGYPDPVLVNEARYLMENKAALPNEIKKFFNYITVDENFQGKMNSSKMELKGTMRANSCRFVASEHADICDQCRLLQEPLNFLGL